MKTEERMFLTQARRVVVKAGTRVLVQRSGRPDARRIEQLIGELAALRWSGREVTCVSSGAIGAGMEALGLKSRPRNLADLQMAAAVGQTRLMSLYDRLFARYKLHVGQVLLTHDGLKDRERHLNARNTMLNLLRNGIVPVVNENDTVANEEIRFGDNDQLAALVAILIDADALVLLTSADGLREPAGAGRTRRVRQVTEVDDGVLGLATGKTGELSTGGMASKLVSAREAARNGVPVILANGRKAQVLTRIFEGRDEGTLILPKAANLSRRKRWIAFFNRAEGTLTVDDGAVRAVCEKGKSLLPVGIRSVEGQFKVGAMVRIHTQQGVQIARGLTEYNSDDLRRVQGKSSREIAILLGTHCFDEAVHRDNMVLL